MPVQSGFSLRQLLTVEPVLFLYAFGLFMNVPVSQQYIYSRLSETKGFPYHFQQKTGCEGKELNDSMKTLEKEVLPKIIFYLCFIQEKLLCNIILHLQFFRFIRVQRECWLATLRNFFLISYLTLPRHPCKKVCMVCMPYVWVIDQVWGQDGWILAKFSFCVFMDRDEVEVHKLAKKTTRPISSGLDRAYLVNKGFIIWLLVKFFLQDTAGSPERARWLHLARSGSQSQRAIWFILPARGASHMIKVYCMANQCLFWSPDCLWLSCSELKNWPLENF